MLSFSDSLVLLEEEVVTYTLGVEGGEGGDSLLILQTHSSLR